jgi:ribosomal protein S18 acetylase RimI-like enzyme
MYLQYLYVDPDVRGSGIGRRLIEASTSLARALDCDVMVVGTEPDNHAAQAVYAACGFEVLPSDGSHFWKKVAPPQDADVQNS